MPNRRSSPDPPADFEGLRGELVAAFRSWDRAPGAWDPELLDAWARRVFRLHLEGIPAYAAYCRRRGVGPDDVAGWADVPPVPTAAFREVSLALRGVGEPRVTFLTSGTSRGRERRGRHAVLDPEIYRASLEPTFRWHVLGGAAERVRIVSLVPPFEASDASSLAWMCDAILRRFGAPGSGHRAGPDRIDFEGATRAAAAAAADGIPLFVLCTTLAADGWARHLAERGEVPPLPAGSTVVDTGGSKGRPGLERSRVVEELGARLGLPPDAFVNEFGMTELLSQRYSRPLEGASGARRATVRPTGRSDRPRAAPAARASPPLYGPPWLRTRALDPETLAPLREGETGLLCHFDLANLASVCAVLTEDLGRVRENVVEHLGRARGAPPRGCSLATAELLAAAERSG